MKAIVNKTYVYLTRGDSVLLMSHLDYPEVGLQVPGGTIEAGESPREAALREVREETGLEVCRPLRQIGQSMFDMSTLGRDEIQRRWFFSTEVAEGVPTRWTHFERHGPAEPVRLEFFWASLDNSVPELAAGQDAFLGKLKASLRLVT